MFVLVDNGNLKIASYFKTWEDLLSFATALFLEAGWDLIKADPTECEQPYSIRWLE